MIRSGPGGRHKILDKCPVLNISKTCVGSCVYVTRTSPRSFVNSTLTVTSAGISNAGRSPGDQHSPVPFP